MSGPYLELRGLKKSFGLKPILRGVDLDIQRGERVALLGANGTGKTTLLRLLAGLLKPDGGTICLEGVDVRREQQHLRRQVGFVGHQPYLYTELSVLENLVFFGHLYGVKQSEVQAMKLLEQVGLGQRARERVGVLSRGQLQRVALVRALLHSPDLLLFDEPDTGLDDAGVALLEKTLQTQAAQNGVVLFTTHQLEHAFAFSDRMLVLHQGRIVFQHASAALNMESFRQAYQKVVQ